MNKPEIHVDLSNCDREPIHALGAIQSFGYIIVLSADWLIARVSANIEALFGVGPEQVIGKPLVRFISEKAIHTLRNRMMSIATPDSVERIFGTALFDNDTRAFDLSIHLSGSQIMVEAEVAKLDQVSLTGVLRSMMTRLDSTDSFEGFVREGARQVRGLTGFDRVMVYRFDEEGSGEVVAEAARPGVGSFLGLHYPASDVPVQARALYLRNLFRIIADVGSTDVPVVPQLDETGTPLDLSLAVTRAVSPIHIEYLRNMGVSASLSISIVIENKLWGLFACHHYSPRLPSLERRSLAELFGQMFAMKLESRERQFATDIQQRAQSVADSLLAALASNAQLLEDPDWLGETLNRAIESDGVGISINGHVALVGMTPNQAEFEQVLVALNGTSPGRVYATDRIASLVPQASQWSGPASGLLAMPISRTPRDYVVLFRQELVRTVRWAGDPHKPAEYGPNGPRLSPRKSFEAWAETVSGRSRPFSLSEIRVAEKLRTTLIEVVLRLSEEAHAERQLASDRQALLIAELNHRVRNILSLIRGLVRRGYNDTRSLDDYIRDIDNRISALARAHNQITDNNWAAVSLRTLIETEAEAYFATKSSHILLEGPDVRLVPNAFSTLSLVLHELMTNSAKYGGLSDAGRVHVSWQIDAHGDLDLQWRESGGPAVQAPSRQGFGSTIIRRSIPYDLGGHADLKFNLAGLEARFRIPARHIVKKAAVTALDTSASATPPSIPERRPREKVIKGTVLLVEDSLIIAIDTEDHLLQLGADRVSAASTVQQALDEIERDRPDLAVLDINLGDQTSLPVADRLMALGVPFVFATGYGERASLPEHHRQVPVVQKPYTIESMARAFEVLRNP